MVIKVRKDLHRIAVEVAGGRNLLYLFRRLTIASAIMPSISPAIMDSQGNPGTAGSVIGVETEALDIEVLTTVIVDTDVLTDVTVSELVVVTG